MANRIISLAYRTMFQALLSHACNRARRFARGSARRPRQQTALACLLLWWPFYFLKPQLNRNHGAVATTAVWLLFYAHFTVSVGQVFVDRGDTEHTIIHVQLLHHGTRQHTYTIVVRIWRLALRWWRLDGVWRLDCVVLIVCVRLCLRACESLG